ncbi:LysR family transcriptional regulator [Novosphingobium sp. G106]|uniref:LysR family transcriptional regulator n=1 Tax=Novosphingobium sp. G106 TaxID=2849500 RepID=UPI001C2D6D9F|nr:LysR family transcriptional regulator [Novosphingobium sp. G106]MBV1691355.1 LysR family transcriptional regulator [Novosphingobium sp. G106]
MDVTVARTFLAAAATGSFVAAAKRVNASPPTVTERIKQLEHLLDVRLFDRDKRGCRLTPAGRRLIEPMQSFVRIWEQARARAAMPVRFERSIRVGGQHALWPSFLIPWLQEVRETFPQIAFRATAAAPAQLNRAIEDGDLDIAFLYAPVRLKGVRIEEIARDRLILVTADLGSNWQDNFVRVDWGESAKAELTARLGEFPAPGLELDLGVLAIDWIVETRASGYVPERLAWRYLKSGTLTAIADAPTMAFSPFVCWRSSLDKEIATRLVERAKWHLDELAR